MWFHMPCNETMGHGESRPELSTYLPQLLKLSQRRGDSQLSRFENIQEEIAECTELGLRFRFDTISLFGYEGAQWVKMHTAHPAYQLFVDAPQQGSDTISVANALNTICVVPSGNQNDPDSPYAIRVAGVAQNMNGERRIVAARYNAHHGGIESLSFSSTDADFPDPEGDRSFPRYSYVAHTDYQGYNQMVRPMERMLDPIQADGVVTPAMVKATGGHSLMIQIHNPQRHFNPDSLFHAPNNLYLPQTQLFVQHNKSDGRIYVGHIQANLNEWEFVISDSLYLDTIPRDDNVLRDQDFYLPIIDTRIR